MVAYFAILFDIKFERDSRMDGIKLLRHYGSDSDGDNDNDNDNDSDNDSDSNGDIAP